MVFKLININSLDLEMTKKYFPMLSDMRKNKIKNMSCAHERSIVFCSEIIARQCLSELLNAPEFSFQLLCNPDFKSIVGNYNAHVCISSEADFVACAVSERPIGISVAGIKPFRFSEAQNLLSDSELRAVFSGAGEPFSEIVKKNFCEETGVTEMFAAYRCLKEAYFKASGRGLKNNVSRTEFLYNGRDISCSDKAYTIAHSEIEKEKNIAIAIIERCI